VAKEKNYDRDIAEMFEHPITFSKKGSSIHDPILYVAERPPYDHDIVDYGFAADVRSLMLMAKGGLNPGDIAGIFASPEEATPTILSLIQGKMHEGCHVSKKGDKWQVIDGAGAVKGTHASEAEATDQIQAMRVNESTMLRESDYVSANAASKKLRKLGIKTRAIGEMDKAAMGKPGGLQFRLDAEKQIPAGLVEGLWPWALGEKVAEWPGKEGLGDIVRYEIKLAPSRKTSTPSAGRVTDPSTLKDIAANFGGAGIQARPIKFNAGGFDIPGIAVTLSSNQAWSSSNADFMSKSKSKPVILQTEDIPQDIRTLCSPYTPTMADLSTRADGRVILRFTLESTSMKEAFSGTEMTNSGDPRTAKENAVTALFGGGESGEKPAIDPATLSDEELDAVLNELSGMSTRQLESKLTDVISIMEAMGSSKRDIVEAISVHTGMKLDEASEVVGDLVRTKQKAAQKFKEAGMRSSYRPAHGIQAILQQFFEQGYVGFEELGEAISMKNGVDGTSVGELFEELFKGYDSGKITIATGAELAEMKGDPSEDIDYEISPASYYVIVS
jgi:hypothetical protein